MDSDPALTDPRPATTPSIGSAAEGARALAALANEALLLDPLGQEVVLGRGADRIRLLNGVVTANLAAVAPGAGARALLLTAKAHVVSDMRAFVRSEDVVLVVAAGQGEATASALSRFAIMDDFTATPVPELELVAVLGPKAAHALASAGISTVAFDQAPAWSHETAGPWWVARVRHLGADGYWVAGSRAEIDRLRATLAARGTPRAAADSPAVEAARILAREPAWGREITDEYFPMEIGLGDAIDYRKGCFLGQEPIVRIRDRGHVNYRLAALELPQGTHVAAGDRLESDAKPKAGKITSASLLPDGRPVALAVVHASLPDGAEVRIISSDKPPLTAFIR
jgi:folate-binding protein YgfZ